MSDNKILEARLKNRILHMLYALTITLFLASCDSASGSFSSDLQQNVLADASGSVASSRPADDDEGIPGYFREFDSIETKEGGGNNILDFSQAAVSKNIDQYFIQIWQLDRESVDDQGLIDLGSSQKIELVENQPLSAGSLEFPSFSETHALLFVITQEAAPTELNIVPAMGPYHAAGVILRNDSSSANNSTSVSRSSSSSSSSTGLVSISDYRIIRAKGER